jgi:hypothetical protein
MVGEVAGKTVVWEGADAAVGLSELGLDVAGLTEVVLQGEYARVEATAHDPLGAAGMDAYRYRVRGLRDRYCPQRWSIARDRGLELIVSPCGRHALVTRGGDAGVGLRDAFPQPSGRIGETTRDAVDMNATLLFDPSWMNRPAANIQASACGEYETRILLVHRSRDIVRAEVSLPTGIEETEDGTNVLGWILRIILPAVDLTDDRYRKPDPSTEIASIEPKITRRQ